MYQVSDSTALLRGHKRLLARTATGARAVPRTVVLLGLVSLLTDVSSEMVATVLPLYLVYIGGFSPLAFGLIDGLYNGATAFLGLAGGYLGDRRRHKDVAVAGYGVSAACKLLLATVGTGLSAIGGVILLDRAGKGLRTAPRDAMISLATPKEELGAAFGVHRAMDTTGAMIGPLVAFGLLAIAPLAFNSLFIVSFLIAVVGVAILVLFVSPTRAAGDAVAPPPAPSLREAFALMRSSRYRSLLLAGGGLSLATASDAFIFLGLQAKLDLKLSLFPLLFVGSATTFMLFAAPMGRLADRVGRGRVLLSGYALLLSVYALLVGPVDGWFLLVASLALLGTYYAATDGVLVAMGSAIIPEDVRGSGLAFLRTATSGARLLASLLFGALWSVWSFDAAIVCFGAGLIVACAAAALLLRRAPGIA